jgi:hypothetical protein
MTTCHWLIPTRILPHPFSFEVDAKPWACLRDDIPRTMCREELAKCVTCPRWEARSLDDAKRDIAFEAWGVGIELPERSFEDARRQLAWDAFGVKV